MQYFLSNPVDKVDVAAFEAACGVGVVVTPEQVEQAVSTEQILIPSHVIPGGVLLNKLYDWIKTYAM